MTSEPEAVLDSLAALHELDLLGGGPYPNLDRLISLASDVCGANLAAFTVHDHENAHQLSTSYGFSEIMPKSECMCSLAMETGQTVSAPDARQHPRLATARYVTREPFVRSFAGAPVGPEPGLTVGVLAIGHTEPGRFGPREIERLERVAELVSSFLEQRRAAIRASRAAAKTEEERQRQKLFELIFNAIQEGVSVHAPRRGIIEVNPACLSIMGLTREEATGRAHTDPRWRTLRPDGSLYGPDEFPVIVTQRTGKTMNNERLGVELPTGEIRWLSVNTVPLLNAGTGAVDFAVVTMKDVTEQHLAEARLTDQNARLAEALTEAERASKAKSDFVGVMSHELRTPMNAVLSCAGLLSQSKLDPVQKRTLGVLEEAGRQMVVLLNDLLDLSSLNANKVRINAEPVSLARLIEDAAVIWAADVRAKGLSLSVIIDPSLLALREVDRSRLLQVIGNLVSNAIKFTTSGSVSLNAWPERGPGGVETVAIEVADTGPGVPSEAAERIFSPFEQIDVSSKRRHGGLGLGLYIARRLAVAMGGDITLETRPGLGSAFTVRILAPTAVEAQQARATGDDAPGEEGRTLDILCVDDNPRNLFVIGQMLRAVGHRTHECSSGAAALDVLRRQKMDVVLLDMVMPDMDGLDVISRLRAEAGPNAQTPIIACTANVLPDQLAAYRRAGTAAVLAKPIDPRAMIEALASAA
jgi:PAS domain S-box-containing protein